MITAMLFTALVAASGCDDGPMRPVLDPVEGSADASDTPGGDPSGPFSDILIGLHMDLLFDGHAWRRQQAIDNAVQIGARVSRSSFLWHLIEPVRGQRNWSRPDAVLAELEAAGLEPVFAIYGSPSWANGVSERTPDAFLYVPRDRAAFDAWLDAYEDFVIDAVNRYRGRVNKWEIWNEQNEHFFWKPEPNIDQYVQFYRRIYAAIKSVAPEAEVAMGGLAGLCCSIGVNGVNFLQGLYDRGVRPDIVNIHPYALKSQSPSMSIPNENSFTDIARIREVMVRNGEGDKPIWVTEWGWATNKISDERQAEYVERSLELLATKYTYVTLATYFVDYDRPPEYYYGLFTQDFQPKPAAERFRQFMEAMQ